MIDITISRNLVINILIHVFVLFVFLYVFFFTFIAKTEEDSLNDQVNDIARNKIPTILKNIDDADKNKVINWQIVKEKAQDIVNNDDITLTNNIEQNNSSLKFIGAIIAVSILMLTILIYIYYRFVLKKSVNLKRILIENLTVFIFVGLIEFMFFRMTASKYVPIYPNTIGNTIFERIKFNIMDTQ